MKSRISGDALLVRRAARVFALQAAGLVAVTILLLVLFVALALDRGQTNAANSLLRSTAATADDVVDPPPGTWLILARSGHIDTSPGLPRELDQQLGELRANATRSATLRNLREPDGREFRVATQAVTGGTVQVVLDLAAQHDQRRRLITAMTIAAGLGLLLAGLLGAVLGRRAIRPTADALALQRTFVADASHELRTPLTLLSTRAQLLDRAIQTSAVRKQVKADSQGVLQDVQLLGEVVEDLLLAADPRNEEMHKPVEVTELVRAVAESARAHAEEAAVILVSDAGSAPVTISGSAPALRRAVLSLVDNAVDHTPAGGQVTVAVRQSSGEVIVSVSDTGPGIPVDQADKILRRFHSGGQRSGRSHYGLGLALTHDVANRHGGQLRLVPSVAGATFELILPRQ